MITTPVTGTAGTGLAGFVASAHSAHPAPDWTDQGTGLSAAAASLALVAFGVRVLSLAGSPPRAAPV